MESREEWEGLSRNHEEGEFGFGVVHERRTRNIEEGGCDGEYVKVIDMETSNSVDERRG